MYKGEDQIADIISKRGKITIEEIATESGINPDSVRRIIEALKSAGYVQITTEERQKISATEELLSYIEKKTFPEFLLFKKALEGASLETLTTEEKSFGIRWAKLKGYIAIENGKLVPVKTAEEVDNEKARMLAAATLVAGGKEADKFYLEEFVRRRFIFHKLEKQSIISWAGKTFSASSGFEVSVESADAAVGRKHPLSALSDKISRIFAEMGFEEMEGDVIQSAFWNFDALFQPQDHPARELADTFYLKGKSQLPDQRLVKKVAESHEKGWRYKWNHGEAERTVLRTHTTALSAKYLSEMKIEPKKYFAIGRVFRNEATDYKHLAEFHQVEGIIAWKNATFRDLLGVLKLFYAKLGFDKVRFRPSFFPYTEPSLEVEIYFEPRKQWLEIGGAGIFRPEVSIPLANIYPVLAWGLSLERPLMLLLELEDIRTFYKNDIAFLASSRIH